MVWVLGLAGSHNGAAALYQDARLVCAVQEERLTRKKRDVLSPGRASRAVEALLADQGLRANDIDLVVAAPLVGPRDEAQRVDLHPTLGARPSLVISHHLAHALSAHACSGFDEAAALVVDGMGSFLGDVEASERAVVLGEHGDDDRETVSIYSCERGRISAREKHAGRSGFADDASPTRLGAFSSLGLMYQRVAQLTFSSWHAAGKVMGLAPYGHARFAQEAFFEVRGDGRLRFNDTLDGIAGHVGNARPYPTDAALHADLAASVQAALEVGLLHLVRRARAVTSARRLVCAGGVFLNGVANERILASGEFDEVFFLPFAEDSGTAVGAAFHGVMRLLGARPGTRFEADTLGPRATDREAALELARQGGARIGDPSWSALAERIARGEVVGLFTGRSELGPRALGQRSILYDPRRPEGRDELNRVKGREAFRPFAPAVSLAHARDWFELGSVQESPFMLRVVRARADRAASIPAVLNVDGTARVQTVRPGSGPLAEVIAAFHALTGVPMVLNTSFNRAGEPIVESACDAVRTFLAMGSDVHPGEPRAAPGPLAGERRGMSALWLDGVLLTRPEPV